VREGHQPTYDIKRKNEKTREIAEKTAREEYTLDWSQSKVFLVNNGFIANLQESMPLNIRPTFDKDIDKSMVFPSVLTLVSRYIYSQHIRLCRCFLTLVQKVSQVSYPAWVSESKIATYF